MPIWARSKTDRKSTIGDYMMVGENIDSVNIKKQAITAKSSVEAEYRVLAHGCCELMWLRILLEEIGFK